MSFNSKQSIIIAFLLILFSCKESERTSSTTISTDMMVRLSEIEIDSIYLDQYLAILKEESEASVRLEPGVISIYPMFQNDYPNEIRILEIYANKDAYEAHLKTEHFLHYKSSTLHMVKSLKLIDMEAIDKEAMPQIFRKIQP